MKKTRYFVFVPICVLLIYLFLDYFNLFSIIGISSKNINVEALGIILPTVVTFCIFGLTYYLVDSWNINKHSNQRDVAKLLISETFDECIRCLEFLQDPRITEYLAKKQDSEHSADNKIINNYDAIPFENESTLIHFAKEGVLSDRQLELYYKAKSIYRKQVAASIILYHIQNDNIPRVDNTISEIRKLKTKI